MMALVVVLVVRMPSICNFHHSHRSIGIECFSLFDTVDYGKLISWIDYYFPCVWTMGMGFSYNLFISKSGSILGDPCVYLSVDRVVCRLVYWSSLTTSQLHHRKISHLGVTIVRAFKHFHVSVDFLSVTKAQLAAQFCLCLSQMWRWGLYQKLFLPRIV